MTQENPLFEGFKPQAIEGGDPIDKPFTEPVGKKKRKSGGKKKKAEVTQGAVQAAASTPPAEKPPRKPRTPKTEKRAPKFDLQTILKATSGLKDADMTAFQKGLELLLDENKAGRERLLAAWGKVFS